MNGWLERKLAKARAAYREEQRVWLEAEYQKALAENQWQRLEALRHVLREMP